MPRRSLSTADRESKSATATLGDVGPDGLERLPEFDAPSQNGHEVELDECGAAAPWGLICRFDVFHAGRHSWQPEQIEAGPAEAPDAEAEQPTLPGTPEAVDAPFVPYEAAFHEADFMSAPGLKSIAEDWINGYEELAHLRGIEIRYFWKRRGGLKGGNPRLGNLGRPSGLAAYALGRPKFALWLAADHVRDLKLTTEQIRAAVLHELCKAAVDPDDHSAYRVVGPDAEVFALEIQLVGLWSLDLREVGAHIKQLGLLDSLELPVADEEIDEEEGSFDGVIEDDEDAAELTA